MGGIVSVLVLLGACAVACGAYLLLLSVAAFRRLPVPAGRPRGRLAVVVPAHDEAELIERCLASLAAQDYPPELFQVIVVADNCSDATAEIARRCGVAVLERVAPDHRGKGPALRWVFDRLLAGPVPPDAFVVVDADSIAAPGLLRALDARRAAGHEAVQAEYLVLEDSSSARDRLRATAFLIFHRVRLRGRAALGLPSALVGNGMLLSRGLLQRQAWDAYSPAEDLEYTARLRERGVRPVFAAEAQVFGPLPGAAGEAAQRLRWEGGRFHVARHHLPRLVRAGALDAALDLAVPPLALLAMLDLAGLAVSAAASAPVAMTLWLAALGCLAAHVLVGLRAAGAPWASYLALAAAPAFALRKLAVYARLAGGFDTGRWERSQRPSEVSARRFEVEGVPIDALTMEDTLARLRRLLRAPAAIQLCTVNLDFLFRSQSDEELMRILRSTEMNVADGAAVVWLGRLLGNAVPDRVAGADLVPRLAALAAEEGVGLFLLGGEHGAAEGAAAELRRRHPALSVHTLEPPVMPLDELPGEEIVRSINESGARVLLVALGHPKQERWIARHLAALDVSVAVGVGCCLDLLAGRVERAPRWMRRAGLEWLFRLLQEPGRLGGRYLRDAAWLLGVIARLLSQRVQLRPRPRLL